MKCFENNKVVLWVVGLATVSLVGAAVWVSYFETPELNGLMEVGGNLHPLFLHLPIGIYAFVLFTAFIAPLLKREKADDAIVRQSLGLTALTAYAAAMFGLLLYMQGDYSGDLIEDHLRWGVVVAVVCLLLYAIVSCMPGRLVIHRILLIVGAVSMSLAGHYGGIITHGDPLAPLQVEEIDVPEAPAKIFVYEDVVTRIFKDKCYRCHSEDTKQKGELLLDTFENIMAGSENGDVIVPGSLADSPLSDGLHLPLDDDYHMPPEGKPQMDPQAIVLVDAWIAAGANQKQLLAETGWDAELIQWAIDYLLTPEAVQEAPEVAEDAPEADAEAVTP
ncbi:MAG: hypothetical protein OSB41_07435 [Kiritimatiellae bacterium]|nr:hypothetical protein [Kiritimatiellia bacterium]